MRKVNQITGVTTRKMYRILNEYPEISAVIFSLIRSSVGSTEDSVLDQVRDTLREKFFETKETKKER